ncbi:MAG TPA: tol-pal system protein YbgF [Candidatus Acidoferrales bacterium]|nr:tol-pal system protein YbgF [Candidatus Acidoferrales bacterium]
MRKQWFVLAIAAMFFGALGGTILAPEPAGAVAREIIELQQQVSQILQSQQDMRSALDSNSATLKTLIQQSLDGVNQLNGQMGSLQKIVQEVQANTGSSIGSMTQQTQGISDNLQDVQARVAKLSQQMTDIQNSLQSIDAKVSGNAPPASGAPAVPSTPGAAAPNAPAPDGSTPGPAANSAPSAMPPISADTLYQDALRDFTSGHYDLARQEFSDYIKNFPSNDLASNSQFYLGEIYYAQNDFKDAISAYDDVLTNYPRSFKLASSLYKKATAELELGLKASGIRDLREVERRFPGSDESRRAHAKLREIGASAAPRTPR